MVRVFLVVLVTALLACSPAATPRSPAKGEANICGIVTGIKHVDGNDVLELDVRSLTLGPDTTATAHPNLRTNPKPVSGSFVPGTKYSFESYFGQLYLDNRSRSQFPSEAELRSTYQNRTVCGTGRVFDVPKTTLWAVSLSVGTDLSIQSLEDAKPTSQRGTSVQIDVGGLDCLINILAIPNTMYMEASITNTGRETADNLGFVAEYLTSTGKVAGRGTGSVASLAPGATARLYVSGPALTSGGSQYYVIDRCVLKAEFSGKTYAVKYNRIIEPRVPVQ